MAKKVAGIFSVVLASSVALAACGNDKTDESSSKKEDSTTASSSSGLADEQVLNLSELQEIPSMDTAKAKDTVSFNVVNNVFEGLYSLGENDELKEGVATSYDVSDDGLTYTFHLREDAKWSNGDPVTAHDFEYAWKRAVDPKTAAEYAYIMFDIKNAEKINSGEVPVDQLGVKAVDDYTFEVQLERAVPYFAQLTIFGTFMPQNQKYVESQGDKFALEADTMIYNGPFVLSSWEHEKGWQYKKNDQYWDKDNVKLDEINVTVTKEMSTNVNLYETGKLDAVMTTGGGLSSEFVDKYSQDPNLLKVTEPSIFFLRLNEKKEELKNVNLRKAISMAFDKQGLADVILNDGSTPANGFVPADFVKGPEGTDGKDFREENGDLTSYDVEKAQEYWETAKSELGKDKLKLELLTYDTDTSKKTSEFIQAELEKNLPGLTVEIKQQPFKQKLELEANMDYEMSLAGWSPDYPDPMTFMDMFVTGSSYNEQDFSNAEYDKLIEEAKTTLLSDLPARWDNFLKAEKILIEDQAVIAPVYQRGNSYLVQGYVKGIVKHHFGGDFSYKDAYVESH